MKTSIQSTPDTEHAAEKISDKDDKFDDSAYLAANPDVHQAVLDGVYSCGADHYSLYGKHENRALSLPQDGFSEDADGRNNEEGDPGFSPKGLEETFDEDTYLFLHPGVADAVQTGQLRSGFEHYTLYGKKEWRNRAPSQKTSMRMERRLANYSPFSPELYYLANRDSGSNEQQATHHYCREGWTEGRRIQSLKTLAKSIGRIAKMPHQEELLPLDKNCLIGTVIFIYVSSRGNLFMNSIARDLADALNSAGARVEVRSELDDPFEHSGVRVFVAPHEFFLTGEGRNWVVDGIIRDSIMLNTEQIQTVWFEQTLPFLLMSAAVIDMYCHSARFLAEAGIPTVHWVPDPEPRPLDVLAFDKVHPALQDVDVTEPAGALGSETERVKPLEFRARPIALNFFGAESQKRDINLARLANVLSNYRSVIYYRRFSAGPLNAENGGERLVSLASNVAAQSKITLNLHRDEFGAFEWFRIVRLGMCSGSLVVSDLCLDPPTFQPQKHFLQDDARHLPDLVQWILSTEDGAREAERIICNCNDLLVRRRTSGVSAASLASFIRACALGGQNGH